MEPPQGPPETPTRHWPHFYARLTQANRASTVDCNTQPCCVATERLPHIAALWPVISTPTFATCAPTPTFVTCAPHPHCRHPERATRVEGPRHGPASPIPLEPYQPPDSQHLDLSAQKATESVTNESALKQLVQGWLQILGPTTADSLATLLSPRSRKSFHGVPRHGDAGAPHARRLRASRNHGRPPHRMVRAPHPPSASTASPSAPAASRWKPSPPPST